MMKLTLSVIGISLLANLFLYDLYDSTSSELHIAKQDVSRLEAMQTSLHKQVEDAYLLREIEAKTNVEWKDEQSDLETKRDVLVAKLPNKETCTQREVVNVSTQTNYVSLDSKLPPDVVSVLSEAAGDLQR